MVVVLLNHCKAHSKKRGPLCQWAGFEYPALLGVSNEAGIHDALLSSTVSSVSGGSADTVRWKRPITGTTFKSNFGVPRSFFFTAGNRHRSSFLESSIWSSFPPFPPSGDVSLGALGADSAAHRIRDEWGLRGLLRGALPLRPLLCYLRDRHRNWTGTGRISRYELSRQRRLICFENL